VPELEDLSDRCLVLAESDRHWLKVLRPAVRMGSLPDGRSLEGERFVPSALEGDVLDRMIDVLEFGAAAIADLMEVTPSQFRLLAWHERARPDNLLLFRRGNVALPFELHRFPVLAYDAESPEGASASRVAIAKLVTTAGGARTLTGPLAVDLTAEAVNRTWRRRRYRNGVHEGLRTANRCMLDQDLAGALRAMEGVLGAEPDAPDLLLRFALLHREAGHWPRAIQVLEKATAVDPDRAAAWRELGIVRDRAGRGGAEDALRRAVDLRGDYAALVSLALLYGRRGEGGEASKLLERAVEASHGQLNLVLPALLLRVSRAGRPDLFRWERERLRQVFEIRRGQAFADPPQDAPWSFFDAAQAALLLGDRDTALSLAEGAREHLGAPWEKQTFNQGLVSLERGGIDVAFLRDALAIEEHKRAPAPQDVGTPGRPFRTAARDAAWFRQNVPCASACPVGTDAGGYVTLLAEGRIEDAYRVARGPNPFASVCGRICAAPCEDACRRGAIDEPVSIRSLKRFLTERHGAESDAPRLARVLDGSEAPCMEGEAYVSHLQKLGATQEGGRRVVVVGGGPAGLACAHDLAFLGYRVTLYEASDRLGGMMRHGIPEYRLPRDVLDREVEAILNLGVEVRVGERLDAENSLTSLMADGVEAAFLASGAGRGRALQVDGDDLDGVVRAIDFLINVHNGFKMDLGRCVVVVGGGNVALDVARTARRGRPPDVKPDREMPADSETLGPSLPDDALRDALSGDSREVHVVARQPMGEWPAQRSVHGREEMEESEREGVVFHALRGIRRIFGEGGRVTGVELAEVVQLTDEEGRYAPMYGQHAAQTIACDAVLLAVGQEPDLDYLEGTANLKRTPNGMIEVDRETLATSVPGIFAGGDAAFGPRTLIEAVAEGKRAARSIHAHLTGGKALHAEYTFAQVRPGEAQLAQDYDRIARTSPACIEVGRRTGIAEVEGVYDAEEARRQAQRCLACHVQTVYDGDLCIACGRCTDVCPYACLSFVSPDDIEAVGFDAGEVPSRVADADLVFMVKDETLCIRCGLCAERCPTGAMTLEHFDMSVAGAAS
jgi:NADPH-dependent glutamate synthase beta subunit-like oxidoreductase